MVDLGELLKGHLDQLQSYQPKYHYFMCLNSCMRLKLLFSFRQISHWGRAIDCRNASELKVSETSIRRKPKRASFIHKQLRICSIIHFPLISWKTFRHLKSPFPVVSVLKVVDLRLRWGADGPKLDWWSVVEAQLEPRALGTPLCFPVSPTPISR